MNHRLNTILYGPPGTGKTYATFQRSVEICDHPEDGLTPAEIHARYSELVEEGRVEFITFHQSYGYEEFVEGLRPETDGDGSGFRLAVRDGVLKRVSERARSAPVAHPGQRRFFKVSFWEQEVFDECMKDGCVRFNGHSDTDFSDPRYGEYGAVMKRIRELYPDSPRPNLWFDSIGVGQLRGEVKRGDIVVVQEGLRTYRAVGEVVGDYAFDPRSSRHPWPHRRAVRWLWKAAENARPVANFQDRNFGPLPIHSIYPDRPEGLLKYLGQEVETVPYVLVIDEINRANISKVLGELITLLEEDKREGAKNEIKLTLPHSNEPFTLPSNLHLLGTMNTADRSIALLDTALRRRFVFEEITPDPSLLEEAGKDTGVDLPAVLQAMNERLEWLRGRDHLIGHAWFRATESREAVDEVMRRKVIPLIAEYFYDDWEKVQAVLGGTDAFVQREKLEPPPGLEGESETRYRWTVRDPFPEDAYEALIAGRGP